MITVIMKRLFDKNFIRYSAMTTILAGIVVVGIILLNKPVQPEKNKKNDILSVSGNYHNSSDVDLPGSSDVIKEAKAMPVYGRWRNFTTKDGLPSDKAYTVRIDGDRVLVGTHDGLAVYENEKWRTYTTEDGLAHNGVVSIDVNELTGDVWIGTLGGLTRWSSGKFTTFTQFNSGMPNDLVYCVYCDGKDIWVATGGGAGHYDTKTGLWDIFTEQNAPMHEPWTYGVSAGDGKVYIAAWGGGVIEYNKKTRHFRDYTDPDGFMEIDLQPDDGVVHDITTATAYADSILWVSTYFGMSRYDGKNWKGYFNTDSGLASNFINFLRAEGRVVFVCSDNGLSSTDGTTWVTYKKDDNNENGKAIITNGDMKKEVLLSPSISHNFIIGVDANENYLWVATSKGVSRGELLH
jgi:ligand-binding sensor domain-containing protein